MHRRPRLVARALALLLLAVPCAAWAQGDRVSIALAVDATDAPRSILHSRETLPVRPGALTLLYPKWMAGEHGPPGRAIDLSGLKILAAGKLLACRRDTDEAAAIRCPVPAGVTALDVSFDVALPPADGVHPGSSASAALAIVNWNQVVLYPGNSRPDDIVVSASLALPGGWTHASALAARDATNGAIQFEPVTLTTLVDSPVLAGSHVRRIDLTPTGAVPHSLDLAGESDAALAIAPAQTAAYRRLVLEANALFGARHYAHYEFLYALSDQIAHGGFGHHQSSDDRGAERTFIDDALRRASADRLPHDFVHSWNGRYRRPAGPAADDLATPMARDLLWVYEGLTQYLGKVLAVRSGLWTPEEYREDLALLYYGRSDWNTTRRDTDFYGEGALLWLDADVTIRGLTGGQKSLDDFCRAFHGGENSGPSMKPYTLDEVIGTLNEVAPYDWKTFFTTRLTSTDARLPLRSIEGAGWNVIYGDTPTLMQDAVESTRHVVNMAFSLGMIMQGDGTLTDVVPGTPAARAGLSAGMKIVAVNGVNYTSGAVRAAVVAGKSATTPLDLMAGDRGPFRMYRVDYHDGERYPRLERDPARPDLLAPSVAPIAKPQ